MDASHDCAEQSRRPYKGYLANTIKAVTTVDASVEQVSGEWIQVYGSDDGYDCIHRRMSTISITDGDTRIISDHQMGWESNCNKPTTYQERLSIFVPDCIEVRIRLI